MYFNSGTSNSVTSTVGEVKLWGVWSCSSDTAVQTPSLIPVGRCFGFLAVFIFPGCFVSVCAGAEVSQRLHPCQWQTSFVITTPLNVFLSHKSIPWFSIFESLHLLRQSRGCPWINLIFSGKGGLGWGQPWQCNPPWQIRVWSHVPTLWCLCSVCLMFSLCWHHHSLKCVV